MSRPLTLVFTVWAFCFVVAFVLLFDTGYTTRRERIDILAPGPYVVMHTGAGLPSYWGWVAVVNPPRKHPRPVQGWTTLSGAWTYDTLDSANLEAQRRHGVAIAVREVI